jgi:hypothetical protein
MSVGKVPLAWKQAVMTPIYKSGLASAVENYRPISLTCVACEIVERVIVHEMLCFMRTNKVITKHQHAFPSGRSTTSN